MTAVATFESGTWSVRAVDVDGEPWFVAADVCRALDLTDTSKTVSLLDADERGTNSIRTPSGDQQMLVISEPGLYSLILRSRKPEARQFKRWITHEVIPSIRRTGRYEAAPAQFAIPQTYAEALMAAAQLAAEVDRQAARVAELEPAAAFADRLAGDGGDYSVRDAAQILNRDASISTGERRLFTTLKAIGWLDRKGTPYQGQVDRGRLVQRIYEFRDPVTLQTRVGAQVRVTPKGLRDLHAKLGGTGSLVLLQQSLPGLATAKATHPAGGAA